MNLEDDELDMPAQSSFSFGGSERITEVDGYRLPPNAAFSAEEGYCSFCSMGFDDEFREHLIGCEDAIVCEIHGWNWRVEDSGRCEDCQYDWEFDEDGDGPRNYDYVITAMSDMALNRAMESI